MMRRARITDLERRVAAVEAGLEQLAGVLGTAAAGITAAQEGIRGLHAICQSLTAGLAALPMGVGTRRLAIVDDAGELMAELRAVEGVGAELRLIGPGGVTCYRPPAAEASGTGARTK